MPSEPRPRRRVVTVLTWLGRALLALVFLGAGVSKLVGEPAMVTMFADIGAGQWLRYAVGALEVLGAVGVLVPRTSPLAAVGLALLMVGATATNLTVLGASPWLPLLLLVLAGLVAWAGRKPLLHGSLTPTGS
ncbi:DoxX-like family protein [Microlunatus sagamiharensis]|uniref:DoxX-like family protein n=1 Tax=Microlunatus sagamiharensis TaxID=546874 RepID=A0A1H2LK93_9ACTN|nr:DoxX family protein [Microlunatus sagamiharensis]SDU81272.1 DoxX-like family protein [Microlunatus sagamiharensis]